MMWNILRRPGAGVLLVDERDRVLLTYVRVRRAWEHPGGTIGWRERRFTNGELVAALRELEEETGVFLGGSDGVRHRILSVRDDAPLGVRFTSFAIKLNYTPRVTLNRRELATYQWVPVKSAERYVRPEFVDRLTWLKNVTGA